MAGKKQMLLIVNPKSGKEKVRNRLLEILDVFIKAGYQVQVYITQEALDAKQAVIRYGARKELIVCCGGDGTLNETVCGLMELPRPVTLGYIPSGSTNDFASSLKLPRKMGTAALGAALGEPFAIDVGRFCGERYFVYVAGFGAFTEVSYLTPQDKKNILGHQAYLLEGVKSLAGMKAYRQRVVWDEGELEGEFIFGMVTNTMSVGGFKGLVNQDVALDDGRFEVLLIRMPKSPKEFSTVVSGLLVRDDSDNDWVYKFKTRSIHFESPEPVDWVLDGEFGGSRTVVDVENLQRQVIIRRGGTKKPRSSTEKC